MKRFRLIIPVFALAVSILPSGCSGGDSEEAALGKEGQVSATKAEDAKPAKADDKFNRFISKD